RHGYQHVGQVAAAGNQVRQFAPGDWVFFGQYVGHRGWHLVDVGEGEPSPSDTHLTIRLPEGVDRQGGARPGVAGGARAGAKRVRVEPGQKVWVAGAGPIGHFSAQAARVKGADVTVTDVVPRRLEAARETGAHRALTAGDEAAWEALRALGPFDRIIDACSA